MQQAGDYFYEAYRFFLVYDVVRALREILGTKRLSEELGITPTMISRYSRRRSKPGKGHLARIIMFLQQNADILINTVVNKIEQGESKREFYVLAAATLALKYAGKIDAIIGFNDQHFSIVALAAQVLDVPLGLVWYGRAVLPSKAECIIGRCTDGSRQVVCYSIPGVSPSSRALLVVPPSVSYCTASLTLTYLSKNFEKIEVYNISENIK